MKKKTLLAPQSVCVCVCVCVSSVCVCVCVLEVVNIISTPKGVFIETPSLGDCQPRLKSDSPAHETDYTPPDANLVFHGLGVKISIVMIPHASKYL